METGREGYHQLIESNNFSRSSRRYFRMTAVAFLVMTVALAMATRSHAQDLTEATSLADLAAHADVVALARVEDTDYRYRREYPYRGSAYLKVLIAYKGEKLPQRLEVYEEGLHPYECYFEQPQVLREGRRYIVFLRADPNKAGRYRGLPRGCALDVLVTDQNRYAVRMPVDGIDLSDDLHGFSRAMTFTDRYALENEESISPARRDALLRSGDLERHDGGFRYTQGIELSEFRTLLELPVR